MSKILVQGKEITIFNKEKEDYISLTDIAKYRNKDAPVDVVKNWMRTKSTIELLGLWEKLNNPDFKQVEFDLFRNEAGANYFVLSPKKWIETTNAIGMISKSGRYGGTYAHKDIAFEFGTWISPTFKLYLIHEYQRLKEIEYNQYNLEWNFKRVLSKMNYHIHTDAIKNHIVPQSKLEKDDQWLIYAEEADLLNGALFGCTAKQWREANPEHVKKGLNIRDFASINELAVLSNIESLNADMVNSKVDKTERFHRLRKICEYQLKILNEKDFMKALKKLTDDTYINEQRRLKE